MKTGGFWIARMTREEAEDRLARAASVVKLMCGIANNAASLVMLDAHDKIKKHPKYRHEVKRLFKRAFQDLRGYERNLLYTQTNRFFHMGDMPAEIRKKYGDITDAQYFEFWQGLGGSAYMRSRPFITSLANKFRLSLIQHGVEHPDILSWGMTAQTALDLADKIYRCAMHEVSRSYSIPMELISEVFESFSIMKVADGWSVAMTTLDGSEYELEDVERRNISQGVEQLEKAWTDPTSVYEYSGAATEDFEDIFRTRGEWKKALREIKDIKSAVS